MKKLFLLLVVAVAAMLPQVTWADAVLSDNDKTLTITTTAAGQVSGYVASLTNKSAITKIVLIGKFNENDLNAIKGDDGGDFTGVTEVDMAEAKFVFTNSSNSVPSQASYILYNSAVPASGNNGTRAIVGGTLYKSATNAQWVLLQNAPAENTTVETISNTSETNGYSIGDYGKILKGYKYVQMQVTSGSWNGPTTSNPNNAQPGSNYGMTENNLNEHINDFQNGQSVWFYRYYKCVSNDNGNTWQWADGEEADYNNATGDKYDNPNGVNLNSLDNNYAANGRAMRVIVYYTKVGEESRAWVNETATAPASYTIVDGDFAYRNNHTGNYENGQWVRLIDYDYYQLRGDNTWQWEQVTYIDGEEHYINIKYANDESRQNDHNMPTGDNQYAVVMGTEYVCNEGQWVDPTSVTESPNYSDMKFTYWRSTLQRAITSKYADEGINPDIFQNCKALTYVDFKAGVVKGFGDHKSVEGYTANSLTINVGQNVTKIAANAFVRCDALKTLTFSAGNGTADAVAGRTYPLDMIIDNGAFEDCVNLQGVTIPNRVTAIGSAAFKNAGSSTEEFVVSFQRRYTDDTKETIVDGWNNQYLTIGANAFAFCSKLKHISLPIRMTSMGEGIFQNSGLESFEIREDYEDAMLKTIPSDAFLACRLTEINIPRSVTRIKNNAFANTPTIKTIRFQKQIVEEGQTQEPLYIESGAFAGGNEKDQVMKDVYVDFLPTERMTICEYNAFNFTSLVGQTNEGSTQMATLHFPDEAWDFYQGDWKRGLAFRQSNLNAFKDGYNGKWGGIDSEEDCHGMVKGSAIGNDGRYHNSVPDKYIAPANGWQQFAMSSTDIDIVIPTGNFMRTYSTDIAYVIPKFTENKTGNGFTVKAGDPMFQVYRIISFSDGYEEGMDINSTEQAQAATRTAKAKEVTIYDKNGRRYIPKETGLMMVGKTDDSYLVYFADAEFTQGNSEEMSYPFNICEYDKDSETDSLTNLLYPSCIDDMRMDGEGGHTPQLAGEPTIGDYNGVSKILLYSTIPYPYYNVEDVRFRLFGYYSSVNKFKRVEGAKITRDKAYLKLPAALFHWTSEYNENDNGSSTGVIDPTRGAHANEVSMIFNEDEEESQTTGIQQVDQTLRQYDNDSYYTLQGAKLNERPTQRGIYIHNGKKIIIK